MKQILTILLLSLIGFTACRHHTAYPLAIQQAEQLMSTRPDSALTLLQGMANTLATLPEETRMYHQLLTIQAKDKQYITHTSDSLINRIVSFYEEYGNCDRLMMAYFYQGSTYRDMNDAPRALKAFQQAIDAGKETKNLILLGQAYGQMGTLLSNHKLYDEALEIFQKTLLFYRKNDENNRVSLTIRNIARMYSAKNLNDSAIYFYERAFQLADDENTRRSIASELGCLYYETNKSDQAKLMLYPLAFSPFKKSNAILYLGLLYHANGCQDSARYFFRQVLECKDMDKRCVAHEYLSKIEAEMGNQGESVFHQQKYKLLQDSIQAITKTDELEKYHLTYNYERLKKAYDELRKGKSKSEHFLISWLVIIVLGCVVRFYFISWKKKRKVLIKQNRVESSSIYLNRVFSLFQKAGRNETKVSEKDWEELQELISKEYPLFIMELSQLAQKFKLSQQEFRMCCLLKLGFINKSISNILFLSKSAISRSQGRLYTKLTGEEESASKMRLFIEEL